ncbi:unnamed protein product [Toxocara canis]|uniref:Syndecan n=1 Tax=Toxocara canis TaxID=6265 RepID=A0A183U2J2_TOXCA|nr:unnamed protein product [Toxocara canis]
MAHQNSKANHIRRTGNKQPLTSNQSDYNYSQIKRLSKFCISLFEHKTLQLRKDDFRMAGVFVLLAFVLLVFVVGSCALFICYWRSKSAQRKEVGMYPGGYATYVGTNGPPRY